MKELIKNNKFSVILIIVSFVGIIFDLSQGNLQGVLSWIFIMFMNLANIRDKQIMKRICSIEEVLNYIEEDSLKSSELLYRVVKRVYKDAE